MNLFNPPAIPQDPTAVDGGRFVPVWVHFFNALVRMASAVSKAISIAASAQGAIATTYTRAGATYTTAEMTSALDELKTKIADLSAANLGVQTTLNSLIAAQKAAGQMET